MSNEVGDTIAVKPVTVTDGSATTVDYTNLPTGLTYDKTTGKVTGTLTKAGAYAVNYTVTSGGNTTTGTFDWTVTAAPVAATTTDQSNKVGDVVKVNPVNVTGDVAKIEYANLPQGLSYDEKTGEISGTTVRTRVSVVNYKVTGADGSTTTGTFKWTVDSVASTTDQTSKVGDTVDVAPVALDTTSAVTNIKYTNLPAGLSYDPKTGKVTGKPTKSGQIKVTYQVTGSDVNGGGNWVWNGSFNWTIDPDKQTTEVGKPITIKPFG